jgi:SET domain-containing protein
MKNLSWRSPRTRVAASPIHGHGLFAVEPFAAGEIVAIKGGYIYDEDEWRAARDALDTSEIQVAETFFIAPASASERDGGMLYTNHSCEPNIGIQGQIVFLSMRDIAAGEELTHDWATTDDLDYEIACNCGSRRCRGTITGKDWLRRDLQARYHGWFAWHIQRRIDAVRSRSG